jgi:hypothetical protein
MLKRSLCAMAALSALALASGCASLTEAGHTDYRVNVVKDAQGRPAAYELQVKDGKEFDGRQIHFQAQGSAVGLSIVEGESKAFKGQAIGAKALSVLPVTDLANIVSGGGK